MVLPASDPPHALTEPSSAGSAGVAGAGRLAWLTAAVFLAWYALWAQRVAGWGDAAKLITLAAEGRFEPKSGHHPLHNLLGAAWLALTAWTGGGAALRMNLLSAVLGAAGVGVACLLAWRLTRSRLAALAGAVALGCSHIYWWVSEVTESYTLHVLLLLGMLWCLVRYRETGAHAASAGAFLLFGLAWGNRSNMPMYAPVVLLYLWACGYSWRAWQQHLGLAAACGVGCLPWLLVAAARGAGDARYDFAALVTDAFETENAGRMFLFHPLAAARNLATEYPLQFAYQFPLVGSALGLAGLIVVWRRDRAVWGLLVGCGALNALFSSTFFDQRVPFFRVTGYAIFALFVAAGFGALGTRWARAEGQASGRRFQASGPEVRLLGPLRLRSGQASPEARNLKPETFPCPRTRRRMGALLVLLAALPVGTYFGLPAAVDALRARAPERVGGPFREARAIPGRDFLWYFFCPAKSFDRGPEATARRVLAVPAGSVVLADFTVRAPLLYYQQIEGRGAGVELCELEPIAPADPAADAAPYFARLDRWLAEGRRVYLVRRDDPLYRLGETRVRYEVAEDDTLIEVLMPRAGR